MLIEDFTDNFFQQVLARHDSPEDAVFVDHERHVRTAGLKADQQFIERLTLRDDQAVAHECRPVYFVIRVFLHPDQQLLGQHDMRGLVRIPGQGKRKSAEASLLDRFENLVARLAGRQDRYGVARNHRVDRAQFP